LCFNELLLSGKSGFQRFQEVVSDSLPDPLLEAAPSFLMKVYSVLQTMPSDSRGLVLQASSEELEKFSMTFDSGADTHVLSLAAAHALFEKKTASNLRVIGVCGTPQPAAMMGKLIITVAVWLAASIALILRLRGRLLAKRFAWTGLLLFAAALLSLWPIDSSRQELTVPSAPATVPARP
jgi:hypothetical protein